MNGLSLSRFRIWSDLNWFDKDFRKIHEDIWRRYKGYPCPKNETRRPLGWFGRDGSLQHPRLCRRCLGQGPASPHGWCVGPLQVFQESIWICVASFFQHIVSNLLRFLWMTRSHITTLHLETRSEEEGQTRSKLVEMRNTTIPIQCEHCFCFRHSRSSTVLKMRVYTHRRMSCVLRERDRWMDR